MAQNVKVLASENENTQLKSFIKTEIVSLKNTIAEISSKSLKDSLSNK